MAEVAIIIMDEFTPAKRSWFAWRDMMHFMDIACCAAILFPIVWRIKHLREAAQTDGKAERCVSYEPIDFADHVLTHAIVRHSTCC